MKALIIGNGSDVEKENLERISYDYIICADGGLNKVKKLQLIPNLIVGDFDSVDKALLDSFLALNIETIKFPPEKDYTDMELAIDIAVKKGFDHITLLCATGTRLDHTLANILLIEKYYNKGINVEIVDNHNIIKLISDNTDLNVYKMNEHFVSIVPISKKLIGLTLENFKYPLDDVEVKRGEALLISNEVTNEKGRIVLKKGTAILFLSKD